MASEGISSLGSGLLRQVAAVLLIDAVTAEVVTALAEADVPSVLLKGPALSTLLYDSKEFRPYVDIDLIVPPLRRQRTHEVLAALGFNDRHAGMRAGERC